MSANREYKNSVFTTLFDDPAELLSLYNALSGNDLASDTPIEIVTLEKVLFNKRRNDVAFVLGDKIIVFIEHQSTINENMPLRLLIYIARIYEKLIDNEAIYLRKLLKIPKPEFIVLYNGTDPFPDEKTLRLSDAYMELPEIPQSLGGMLELEARVINISEGRNEAIVKRCEALADYVIFTGKVRANVGCGMDLTTAVIKAVKECISEGVLGDFLILHSSEVFNMLTTEWNDEVAKKVWEQEAREEGREEGVDIGAEIMRALIRNEPVESIAERCQVTAEKVVQIQSVLAQLPA